MPGSRPVLLSTALTLLIASCGQSQIGQPAEVDPYANGASHRWSYTAPEGRLTTLSLTPGENNLSSDSILDATNSWGPVEVDRSNGEQAAGDGKPLSINGKRYTRGYGTHAGSELRFSLKGTGAACTRFTSDVGVDDEVGKRGKVVFQVFLDGIKAYDSGLMKGKDPARQVDLDITGKQELRLVVTDGGNGIHFDHANWAQPKVFCHATNTTPNVQMTLDSQELTIFHKHSAKVRATFLSDVNLDGPLDLRLEPTEPGKGPNLQLVTTRVNFSGPETATQDITIAAPSGLENDPARNLASYRLVASRNGQDVASAPLTIGVRALTVKAHFETAAVSSRAGETRRVTVVVTVDPPLDTPQEISLVFAPNNETSISYAEIVNISPSRGDGATMRADADIRFFDNPNVGSTVTSGTYNVVVSVGDVGGYRIPGYGTLLARLELNLIR